MLKTFRARKSLVVFMLGLLLIGTSFPSFAQSKGSISTGQTAAGKTGLAAISVQNVALTAGVTLGAQILSQVANGQSISVANATRALGTAEFMGGVAGSAIGAAGGQMLATVVKGFLPGPIGAIAGSLIPVLGSMAGSQEGSLLMTDLRSGTLHPIRDLGKINYVDVAGSSIGSCIGMMLGAPIPIVGPLIGGMIGGFLGSKIATSMFGNRFLGSTVGSTVGNSYSTTYGGAFSGSTGMNLVPVAGSTSAGSSGIQVIGAPTSSEIAIMPNVQTPSVAANKQAAPATNVQSSAVSGDLAAAERKYYETYLNYNSLVDQGKTEEAKKVAADLKACTDNYNQLKAQAAKSK
ncbi:MAG: hypothetical protein HQM08_04250 [Candidatus Riflebacteria bacterium]|nr:hypothetical protein [Candidatus Riflebacteria bacterium]